MRRCKRNCRVQATSCYQCIADVSGICRKCRSLPPKSHLFTQKLQQTFWIGLSILNPNFPEIAFYLVEIWANQESLNSILQAMDELVYFWRMEILAVVESWNSDCYPNLSFWEVGAYAVLNELTVNKLALVNEDLRFRTVSSISPAIGNCAMLIIWYFFPLQ